MACFCLPASLSDFFLLRHKRRIGVPENPASDLSCFSIYRRYVSGKSFASFTKKTNVGGLIAACAWNQIRYMSNHIKKVRKQDTWFKV